VRYVAAVERLVPHAGADARFRLIQGHRDLGRLYSEQGNAKLALQEFNAAIAVGESLRALDPANEKWLQSTQSSRLMLARELFDNGNAAQAAEQIQPICSTFARLMAKDPNVGLRSAAQRDCLILQARIAAHSGDATGASSLATQAVRIARSVKSIDPADAKFGLAGALRVLGDTSTNDPDRARSAWREALAAIPAGVAEKPIEMDEHARILERLGRSAEAAALKRRLAQIGYGSEPNAA
jgi:tetratricopeptide (TPR) repeat protein